MQNAEYVHSKLYEQSSKCSYYFVFIEPNPVTNIATSHKGTRTVRVTWTAPSHQQGDNFDGYEYQLFNTAIVDPVRSENNLSPRTTATVDINLTPGNTYLIEIKSFIFDASNIKLYGTVVSLAFTMSKYIIMFLS